MLEWSLLLFMRVLHFGSCGTFSMKTCHKCTEQFNLLIEECKDEQRIKIETAVDSAWERYAS